MGEVEMESTEEVGGGGVESLVLEEEESVEEEGVTEVRVQAEEWLPTIDDGNEVLTSSTHPISTAHHLISTQMTTPFLLHIRPQEAPAHYPHP